MQQLWVLPNAEKQFCAYDVEDYIFSVYVKLNLYLLAIFVMNHTLRLISLICM